MKEQRENQKATCNDRSSPGVPDPPCGTSSESSSPAEAPFRKVSDRLTALILCGGRGERLRPLTDVVPKPLLPLNGRPILEYLLEHLSKSGIRHFVLCTGYKGNLLASFARKYSNGDQRVECSASGDVSMSDRLLRARPFISGQALVCYGDTLADVSIERLLRAHEMGGLDATVTVYPYRSPFGIVTFDQQGVVTKVSEKPELPYWINIGFLVCEPTAFERLNPGQDLAEFLSALAAAGSLGVYQHEGKHWTANTQGELKLMGREMRQYLVDQEKA